MNLAVTVALLPALFTDSSGTPRRTVAVRAGATLETVPVVATAAPGSSAVVVLGPTEVAAEATTTTTTAPPPPTTTMTVRPAPRPATKTTVAARPAPKPTTTTTTAPATTTTTAPPREPNSESGKASWYDHQPGICAHKSLPFGTVVTVTNTNNGRRVQCTVGDRGPYVDGWIIDLNPREFEQLAPTSAGVIPVTITW